MEAIVYDIAVRYIYPLIGLRIGEYCSRVVSHLQFNPPVSPVKLILRQGGPNFIFIIISCWQH